MPRITSWLEVEKRLANYNNQIKSAEDRLVKTNDSINAFLNALVLNLKDLLESQSDISLWFYNEDEPTTSNLPYTSWTTPSDHYGDFFYSRTKGLVFQFTSNGWVKLEDATMLNAMALTNSKLGANDHERKVFLDNPTTPYTSGDWWIREDGTLYICQLSRASGKREENDFIDALNYAEAVAKATDNIVEVLKGTLITTTDNAVIYEDKATHKTTTISGDSIRTGEIISNNYVANTSGTKFNLNTGEILSKNFSIDSSGNASFKGKVEATSGYFGSLVTANGVYQTIVVPGLYVNPTNYSSFANMYNMGYSLQDSIMNKTGIYLNFYLPTNFTIDTATITLSHIPIKWTNASNYYGYVRSISVRKKISTIPSFEYASESPVLDDLETDTTAPKVAYTSTSGGSISNNTWTPANNSANTATINVKNQITSGYNSFVIKSDYAGVPADANNEYKYMGILVATLQIKGYGQV